MAAKTAVLYALFNCLSSYDWKIYIKSASLAYFTHDRYFPFASNNNPFDH